MTIELIVKCDFPDCNEAASAFEAEDAGWIIGATPIAPDYCKSCGDSIAQKLIDNSKEEQ